MVPGIPCGLSRQPSVQAHLAPNLIHSFHFYFDSRRRLAKRRRLATGGLHFDLHNWV
jgi:hypothetical protein